LSALASWSVATASELTKPYAESKTVFPGQNYSIVSDEDSVLTVIHNATEQKLSLAKSGEALENSLTLEHSEEIRAIAQKMTEIVSSNKATQIQA